MATIKNKDIAKSIFLGSKNKTGNDLHLYTQSVVRFLNRKRLTSKAPEIIFQLKKIINDEAGIVEGKVLSAKKLSTEVKHNLLHTLKSRYAAKDVVLEEKIDESLIGGFRIEVNDEIIDASLKNKVVKLQEYLKVN